MRAQKLWTTRLHVIWRRRAQGALEDCQHDLQRAKARPAIRPLDVRLESA